MQPLTYPSKDGAACRAGDMEGRGAHWAAGRHGADERPQQEVYEVAVLVCSSSGCGVFPCAFVCLPWAAGPVVWRDDRPAQLVRCALASMALKEHDGAVSEDDEVGIAWRHMRDFAAWARWALLHELVARLPGEFMDTACSRVRRWSEAQDEIVLAFCSADS